MITIGDKQVRYEMEAAKHTLAGYAFGEEDDVDVAGVVLLECVPGVDVAVAHKTLHHKRPSLFPLLDTKTVTRCRNGGAWAGIHEELVAQADEFSALEDWFAGLAVSRAGVALTRLRIHDILLWCDVMGERQEAEEKGRRVSAEGR